MLALVTAAKAAAVCGTFAFMCRFAAAVLTLFLLAAAPASARENPLTGEGNGFELVANLPLDPSDVAASDLELPGNYAFVGSYSEGLVIADISDPSIPSAQGRSSAEAVAVRRAAVRGREPRAADHGFRRGVGPATGASGSMVIDATDRTSPRLESFIERRSGRTRTRSTTARSTRPLPDDLLEARDLRPVHAVGAEEARRARLRRARTHPRLVRRPPAGRAHPAYAASIGFTDVIDVTDPRKPQPAQRFADPQVTISHQAEPNSTRDTLIVTDEFARRVGPARLRSGGDTGARPRASPAAGDPFDLGALHLYRLDADGTRPSRARALTRRAFNLPLEPNAAGGLHDPCLLAGSRRESPRHRLVRPRHPRRRLRRPVRAAGARALCADRRDTWSAKPHRVDGRSYIYTGDINRGIDVSLHGRRGLARHRAADGAAALAALTGPPDHALQADQAGQERRVLPAQTEDPRPAAARVAAW